MCPSCESQQFAQKFVRGVSNPNGLCSLSIMRPFQDYVSRSRGWLNRAVEGVAWLESLVVTVHGVLNVLDKRKCGRARGAFFGWWLLAI